MLINGIPLKQSFIFSGGEVQIKLPDIEVSAAFPTPDIHVKTRLTSSDKIMELLLVKDALDFYFPKSRKTLEILYVPYARQDRRCNSGEALSSAVFVNLLNSLNFSEVKVADLHTPLGIRNVIEITPSDILHNHLILNELIVCPDTGALARAHDTAYTSCLEAPVVAQKIRDQFTGRIIAQEIINGAERLRDRHVIIVDDICDAGGTFIGLAKILAQYNPLSISLYVTHGIFSKGLEPLFTAGISRIITTDSVCTLEHNHLQVIKL